MTRQLRSQSGMTLVELLAAMTAGIVVLLGAFGLVDVAIKTQKDTEQRISTVAAGRQAMDDITRQLRSQICLDRETVPIIDARPNRVTFYASLAPASNGPVYQRRTLEYFPAPDGRGRVEETVVTGTGTPPNVGWAAAPVRRTLLRSARPLAGRTGLFRYHRFEALSAPQMFEVVPDASGSVSESDRRLTVQIDVGFEVLPEPGRSARLATLFENKVYVRTADPTDPTRSPKCT
jgi:type II secretory pathway pseudopilin PulG